MLRRTHPSKIDTWLVGVLLGSAIIGLLCAQAAANKDPGNRASVFGAYFIALTVSALFSLPTTYSITDSEMVARSGVLRWKVALQEIQAVYPNHNIASGPAWSSDRLQIRFVRGGLEQSLSISPVDKRAFLEDLHAADPNLIIDRDGIRRREFPS